jgi:hypothetical protein
VEFIQSLVSRNNVAYLLTFEDNSRPESLKFPSVHSRDFSSLKPEVSILFNVSRFCVKYNLRDLSQNFYEGHISRITAFTVDSTKELVASCSFDDCAYIHVWKAATGSSLKKVKTEHLKGVSIVKFSFDCQLIGSVSVDDFYSLQIMDWSVSEIIAFNNTGREPILDLEFNPQDRYKLCTGGYNKVMIWELKGKTLILANLVQLNQLEKSLFSSISCISYISYYLNSEPVEDILVATTFGDLGVISDGRYATTRRTAHKKMINCLRVTELFKSEV